MALNQTIAELFSQQASLTPDHIAIVYEGQTLTYQQLEAQANQLAHYLLVKGIEKQSLVGIFLDRSLDLIVAILGIMKAGAAYLPLDRQYPQERLAYMLNNAQAPYTITLAKHQSLLTTSQPLCLDELAPLLATYPTTTPDVTKAASDLAYVIYTSGSTGRPKGVCCHHQGVINLLAHCQCLKPLESTYRASLWTNTSFDVSVYEIFSPLLSGASLYIANEDIRLDNEQFINWLLDNKINSAYIAPHILPDLARVLTSKAQPSNLQRILVGVEPIPEQLLTAINRTNPQLTIINGYGPTETTICCTLYVVPQDQQHQRRTPIGKAVDNNTIYLLDKDLAPVPAGVVGEIYVGGIGLAHGYLNNPTATAERFIPSPFSKTEGERLYRTGDLAKYLADGNLEFIGRADHQVKLRGYRIELGEIEHCLASYPTITTAVVVVKDITDVKSLVAYLQVNQALNSSELRNYLKQFLPEYMMPNHFVEMKEWPLTANGKIDRNALIDYEIDTTRTVSNYEAPTTPMEELVAAIWQEVLKTKQIGRNDNFFELGGHSLLATQVKARLQKALQQEVKLTTLFEKRNLGELAAYLETLTAAKSQLKIPPIEKVARTQPLPLSFAQERLWFLQRLAHNSAYNIAISLRLTGTLNISALKASLNQIVKRHETLRTTYQLIDETPIQVVAATFPLELLEQDISSETPELQKQLVDEISRQQATQPFNLAESVIRVSLIKLAAQEHILLIVVHHIITDAWSISLILKELSQLYNSYLIDQPITLPELPIQYADYAVWQRSWLKDELLAAQLQYWQQHLGRELAALDLPLDRPRPNFRKYQGSTYQFVLSRELSQQLPQLCQKQDVTLFMLLLAAFQTLLYRYSGQAQIIVGTALANRNIVEVESLIGFFANTLAIGAYFTGQERFTELLAQVKKSALGAYEHEDLPFEKLVEALQPERSLNHTPIYQVMMVLQNAADLNLTLTGIKTAQPTLLNTDIQTDLILNIIEDSENLRGIVEYDIELFDQSTIARMAGHLQTLLTSIVADISSPISQLAILTEAERHQLLVEWNPMPESYDRSQTILSLFNQQVALVPDKIALIYEEESLTYRELDAQANQLAHYLLAKGVKPEDLIGIFLDRSLQMIVAILATIKAGAAYLPLDRLYPANRLAYMLNDAQVPYTITLAEHQALLTASQPLCLDSLAAQLATYPTTTPDVTITPNNLAYVIYTSGSTGQPKGVMVPHQGVVRLVKDNNYADLNTETIILQFSPISFDVATFEIWGVLLNGGCLAIFPAYKPNLAQLSDYINKKRVTTLWLTSGLFHQLVEENLGGLPNLKQLLAGGDVLSPIHVKKALQQLGTCEIINGYGPTENTTFTSCYRMLPDYQVGNTILIGKPIAQTTTYILDKNLQPVSIGVVGELYTGGLGLARGYLNKPELTAARFIPNPFSQIEGDKLYHTGDLARYLPDGNIEFLGRADNQVKVRGYRIELGEIEHALSNYEGIKAAVVGVKGTAESKHLVAYLVTEKPLIINELKNYLHNSLPDYMVPANFIELAEFPLNANGKVDRHALLNYEIAQNRDHEYQAPLSTTEKLIAGIWQEVLKTNQIGRNENFFDLGGHSLLAVQVSTRLQKTLQVEISLRTIFERPRLVDLATQIETLIANRPHVDVINIPKVSHQQPLVLAFSQERLWILQQLDPSSNTYNIPLIFKLQGDLNREALIKSLTTIVSRHEILRTHYQLIDGQPRQVIDLIASLSIAEIDLSILNISDVDKAAKAQEIYHDLVSQPLELSTSVTRWALIKISNQEYILVTITHHIAMDGWSLNIFYKELAQSYQAYVQGQIPELPQLPIQYADYAVWQRGLAETESLSHSIKFWQEYLQGHPPVLELPTDYVRPPIFTETGRRVTKKLSTSLSQSLRFFSKQQEVTMFMTMLAAFKVLLYRLSGQTDIVVGSPWVNRDSLELENLLGVFLNNLVFRSNLAGSPSFKTLLTQLKQASLQVYMHQQVPFEQLLAILQPVRDLSYTPIFQVLFNFLKFPETDTFQLPGVKSERIDLDIPAKFDITLYVVDEEEIYLDWVYRKDLFSATRMQQMIDQYEHLLSQLVANPEQSVDQFSLVTPLVRRLLPNPTLELTAPQPELLLESFLGWVEGHPDTTAVSWGKVSWTYRQLAEISAEIARSLIDKGLKTGDVVAIVGQRSLGFIATVLAILRSGGVLLTIDSKLPLLRQSHMLKDAQAQALCYFDAQTTELLTKIPLSLNIDSHTGQVIGEQSTNVPLPVIKPEQAAYIFFTSGSTGKPKGILGHHKGLGHFLTWQRNTFNIQPTDRCAQLTGLSFDVLMRDIFLPLTSGAMLCLPEFEVLSGENIFNWLQTEQISVIHTVPSLMQYWLATNPTNAVLPNLTKIFFAGEPLKEVLIREFRGLLTEEAQIINLYGPTETTLAKCYYVVPSDTVPGIQPVGQPLPETQVLILTAHKQLCGLGEAGEITIRTPFRSYGYINSPPQNQAKFVPNPFRQDETDIIYYTGDYGYYRTDGTIQITGRQDNQIKINGIRIELEEIESILSQSPLVQNSVVVAKEIAGSQRLIGYISTEQPLNQSEIRSYLKESLPDYMIPSHFVVLAQLPLTPNGKVDRKALQKIELKATTTLTETPELIGWIEEVLAEIWSEVLKIKVTHRQANFFELGGHSLLAIQTISRIEKVLEVKVRLHLLFEFPVLQDFAIQLNRLQHQNIPLPPIKSVSREQALPLSFAQQRLWVLDQLMPNNSAYNTALKLKLKGDLDVKALSQSINEIVRRHENLRTNFGKKEGKPTLTITPKVSFTLKQIDLTQLELTESLYVSAEICSEEAQQAFNLAQDLLIKGVLIKLSSVEHILLLTLHHIVTDGWSLGILFQELKVLYEAYRLGKPSPLKDLAIQYVDYAYWEKELLNSNNMEKYLDYWREYLGEGLSELQLPLDYERPKRQTYNGAKYSCEIDQELLTRLKQGSQKQGVSLFMVLMAAFKVMLYSYSQQKEILIGTPYANRNNVEVEGIIGFFVNILPIKTFMSDYMSFGTLVQRIKRSTLGAYEHQEIPMEKVLERLKIRRSLHKMPIQAAFALQNLPQTTLELAGLTIELLTNNTETAKLDLSCYAYEIENGMCLLFEYNTDIFEPNTITNMGERYLQLLKLIPDHTDISIETIRKKIG